MCLCVFVRGSSKNDLSENSDNPEELIPELVSVA